MRQTIRLDEVRAPRSPNDALSPSDVLAIDGAATTLDGHYAGVLSQIRSILGTPVWRDQPAANLAALGQSEATTARALAAQAASLTRQAQILSAQAASIAALQGASADLAAIKADVASLELALSDLMKSSATRQQLEQFSKQLTDIGASTQAQFSALNAQVAVAASQQNATLSRVQGIEAQLPNFVTIAALTQQIAQSLVVDQALMGDRDRRNLTFRTQSPFLISTLRVIYNGQSLNRGDLADYVVASASAALSSDTIRLNHAEAAPGVRDILTASFVPA